MKLFLFLWAWVVFFDLGENDSIETGQGDHRREHQNRGSGGGKRPDVALAIASKHGNVPKAKDSETKHGGGAHANETAAYHNAHKD